MSQEHHLFLIEDTVSASAGSSLFVMVMRDEAKFKDNSIIVFYTNSSFSS